jgi:transposase
MATPSDLLTLEALVAELTEQVANVQRENARLRHQLDGALRQLYGRKTERWQPPVPEQGQLPLAGEAAQSEESAASSDDDEEGPPAVPTGSAPTKRRRGRTPIPRNLPRSRTVIEPSEAARTCSRCTTTKTCIGSDVTEELDYTPAVLRVHEIVRPKYACPHCAGGVVQAAMPARPIDQGRPGPGLLAHVVTAKFADHLPLHRLEGIFGRGGLRVSRRTLCDWVAAVAELVEPIVKVLHASVKASPFVYSDDTPITVQDRHHPGGSRRAYVWVYGGESGDLVYDYTPSRSREGPERMLDGYRGYLQADAYSGYETLFASGRIVEVACWAHARRYVRDAVATALQPATRLLALIRRLYAVERAAHDFDPQARQARRQEESQPILDELNDTVVSLAGSCLPKSPLAEALGYVRRQWVALTRYVEDGRLSIDNNAAERALRRVAVGRKNWLFAGSDAGGRRAAILYSLIGTCQLIGVEPFAYLRDVIGKIPSHPNRRLLELTPRGWKAAQAAT